MDFLELEADSVQEAVTKACRRLKVSEDQIDVEVLREGEFEEPYLVRVSIKQAAPAPKPTPRAEAPRPAAAPAPRPQAPKAEAKPAPAKREPVVRNDEGDRDDELGFAIDLLQDFLDTLDFPATISGEIKDEQILLNVESEDGGTLIGRKGATLNALQHVINSVVRSSKYRVIVDISGYRARSAERLEEIAHRVAKEALDTKRRVELKPMTPAERRIIHMAIATYEGLATESVGEEPYRRIVVIPPGAPPLPAGREPRGRDRGPREGGRGRGDFGGSRGGGGYGGERRDRPAYAGGGERRDRPARGGVDRWGYTRDIPAEAKEWIDENQTVKPISGAPAPGGWSEFDTAEQQPWVKDQPTYRQAPPTNNPWGDTDYREGSSAEDRW